MGYRGNRIESEKLGKTKTIVWPVHTQVYKLEIEQREKCKRQRKLHSFKEYLELYSFGREM